jgi:hypothetical protein
MKKSAIFANSYSSTTTQELFASDTKKDSYTTYRFGCMAGREFLVLNIGGHLTDIT